MRLTQNNRRMIFRNLDVFTIVFILTVVISYQSVASGEQASGPANVITGDTLEVSGHRFKLFGIAAPNLPQSCTWPDKIIPCGDVARTALMDLVVASQVDCEAVERGVPLPDGSIVARCYVDGFDVGKNMIHTGWAIVAPHESREYEDTQAKAQVAERGVWKGEFELPWEWHADD